jgi:hypothetical protein
LLPVTLRATRSLCLGVAHYAANRNSVFVPVDWEDCERRVSELDGGASRRGEGQGTRTFAVTCAALSSVNETRARLRSFLSLHHIVCVCGEPLLAGATTYSRLAIASIPSRVFFGLDLDSDSTIGVMLSTRSRYIPCQAMLDAGPGEP